MMENSKQKSKRALTGVCSSGCIMLELNREVFEIIGKDKVNK
jgi:hypothetical protein